MAGPAGTSGRAFTSKERGSDSDRIMKQAPWRSGQPDVVERPAADRLHAFFIRADSLGSNPKSPVRAVPPSARVRGGEVGSAWTSPSSGARC
jgi:hypothetical protein